MVDLKSNDFDISLDINLQTLLHEISFAAMHGEVSQATYEAIAIKLKAAFAADVLECIDDTTVVEKGAALTGQESLDELRQSVKQRYGVVSAEEDN